MQSGSFVSCSCPHRQTGFSGCVDPLKSTFKNLSPRIFLNEEPRSFMAELRYSINLKILSEPLKATLTPQDQPGTTQVQLLVAVPASHIGVPSQVLAAPLLLAPC